MSEQIIRQNLRILSSPEARDIALTESVGGNAGTACYALNLEVLADGRIAFVGNGDARINATLRIYLPAFAARPSRMKETAIELLGDLPPEAKAPIAKAAWLWNLLHDPADRPIVRRFMDDEIDWRSLLEILRTKYPELVRELE